MRLVSFLDGSVQAVGVLDPAGAIAPIALPPAQASGMVRLLRAGDEAVRVAAALALSAPARLDFDAVRLLPLVPDPHAIWCAAGTFRAHLQEGGHQETAEPPWFLRVAESLCAHDAPIVRPLVSERLDFEGELAVVIGRTGRWIPQAEAMDHIAGFTCFNDGSIRDWQRHSTQIAPGKNFASTGALGPWLVTPDEFGDPYSKRLETRLNDIVVQSAPLSDLMFSIEHMVAYLSTICQLRPGDVIATGTCAGVGNRRTPQLFMKHGDRVEVTIDGIGTLSNPVADEIRP